MQLNLLPTVQQAIANLLTVYEPEFLRFGYSLFLSFATILIVWQGVKMMFSHDSLGDSMFDFVDARPTTGCIPITVCERPTGSSGDDVRASIGCDVAARGNGGGTDAARSAGGVVPIGVRRGIGGGCDVRIAGDDVCVWGWGSTAVCSSFVAIATGRDAPGEPELPQSIRGLGCRLSRETG